MSHFKEREEKNCLNCNAQLLGTYCHICGQENIHPKESVWHLVSHFFQDITHFDGKFFSTGKMLITRPGYLPAEYARGRRASYLNPIRMYVFTSAFFFLIFFSFIKPKETIVADSAVTADSVMQKLRKREATVLKKLTSEKDTGTISELKNLVKDIDDDMKSLARDTNNLAQLKTYKNNSGLINIWSEEYPTRQKYDSVQNSLPLAERHGYVKRTLLYKIFDVNKKYKNNNKAAMGDLLENFFHHLPQLLFVSLPFFALLLKLLYARRKSFYYVSHLIFTLHFYIFFFISLLVIFSLSKIHNILDWGIIKFCIAMVWLFIFFYLYKAMRNFYGQRRAKTIFKFVALNFLFQVVLMFLFTIFFFYSFFQI